jgi:hypothetical protein
VESLEERELLLHRKELALMKLKLSKNTTLDVTNLPPITDRIAELIAHLEGSKKHWANASFEQTCLESRLDRRNTTFRLDNENNVKILLGVSGAGKTRQLLELLHMQYGYYFVTIINNNFGSFDFSTCQAFCERSPDLCDYYITLLYFVRAFVCNYLIHNGVKEPWQILLAQIYPYDFFGDDIFNILFLLLARKVSSTNMTTIVPYFDFVAIDEIQHIVESPLVFQASQPFLSPLVSCTKKMNKFPKFILSGTGINFQCIKNALGSDSHIKFKVISNLEPLDQRRVAEYSRLILQDKEVDPKLIEKFVNSVTSFDLCHGRARFIASILELFLETRDIELAINTFLTHLTNMDGQMFPLKFYRRDIIEPENAFRIRPLGKQWESQILDCMLQFIYTGRAVLNVSGQEASDAVKCGLGFCEVIDGCISSIDIVEVGIIYCLRYYIPFSSFAQKLTLQMKTFPSSPKVEFILQYLVGFALVSNLKPQAKDNMKVFASTNAVEYLNKGSENEIFLPVQNCGPHILYKTGRCVHIVRVQFVDQYLVKDRLQACQTTDPEFFYWNPKTSNPLKGCEERRAKLVQLLKTFELNRYVVAQRDTKATAGMDLVVITKSTQPHFFDRISTSIWRMLDQLRKDMEQKHEL